MSGGDLRVSKTIRRNICYRCFSVVWSREREKQRKIERQRRMRKYNKTLKSPGKIEQAFCTSWPEVSLYHPFQSLALASSHSLSLSLLPPSLSRNGNHNSSIYNPKILASSLAILFLCQQKTHLAVIIIFFSYSLARCILVSSYCTFIRLGT